MQSERLKYCEIEQGHSPLLFSLYTDPDVRKYLGGAMGIDAARERVIKMTDNPPPNHWILQNECNENIGLFSLTPYYDGLSTEVSYQLLPKYTHNNYAFEALKFISNWAFAHLEIANLYAETQLANKASIKLLEKSGFEMINQLKRHNATQLVFKLDKTSN